MNILYDEARQVFHLQTPGSSYVMGLVRGKWLCHLYWGRRIAAYTGAAALQLLPRASFSPNPPGENMEIALDVLPMEYPTAGSGDYRPPAAATTGPDGDALTDLLYKGYRILPGKPPLPGLPAVYAEANDEAMTLEICLRDEKKQLDVFLLYTVFARSDAICRSVRFANSGVQPLCVTRSASACLDMRRGDLDLITLWGAHANERNVERRRLPHGESAVYSTRGASSHQFSPFLALAAPDATETSGEVFAASLVYSGNFYGRVYREQFGTTRMAIGLDADGFGWQLDPGQTFQTPEAVLAYSPAGLGGISHIYHRLYRSRLMRGEWRDRERPILINNWEATYFDFDQQRLLSIARQAAGLGIELFVLDDGWFGRRDSDNSSLGDWTANPQKLPEGLKGLAKELAALGMDFGIWMEPEMVSPDSDLYRAHPDWVLAVPGRQSSMGRCQLVLDLCREEVRRYIVDAVGGVLSSADIRYVKWDMNRNISEAGSTALPAHRQSEVMHRYMLGLYAVLEELTARFPHVLFESCAGGGGRFDAGMLYYMPQTWTSDNTDAVCRAKIQWGTSLAFPPLAMGCHVSAVPNHQVGRISPLATRGIVAMAGVFRYELDLTHMSHAELAEVKQQVECYKKIRKTVQFGSFYRLQNPFTGNTASWCFVAQDQSEAVLMHLQVLSQPAPALSVLHLAGLDADAHYRDAQTGTVYAGDELMYSGFTFPPTMEDLCDFRARMWVFHRV